MSWKQEDGWSKPGDRSHRRPRDRGKPGAPVKDDSGEVSTWEASKSRSDKRHKRRSVIWIIASFAVVLLLLVAIAPMIASIFAPGIISSKATDAIAGRVEVGSARLGWFGGQRVERVRVYDDKGEQRGEITAKTDMGLLGLLLAGGDYGVITLSGELDVSTNARGKAFLEHTVGIKPKPSAPPPPASPTGKPITLPKNLHAVLLIDDMTITYGDESATTPVETVRIKSLDGDVSYLDGLGALVAITGRVQMKRPGDRIFADAGKLTIGVNVSDLTDSRGEIQTDKAEVLGNIIVSGISTDMLDLLPDFAGKGRPALGPIFSASIEADGRMNELDVTLSAESESLNVNAPLLLNLVDGSLHSTGTITAGLDLGRLSMLLPDRDALVGPEADLHVTEFPRLDVTIEGLSLPIPPGNTADLRGAGAVLRADIGALAATVRTPGDDTRRSVGFEPATIMLDAASIAGVVTLRTELNTTIDNKASGTLLADLSAENLLDDNGAISVASPPTIRGEVKAEQLVLAAFQPIAAAAGFDDLTGIIGDTADLTLTASPVDGVAGSTDLALDARADHAALAGTVRLDERTLRTTGDGLTARFDRLAPLLADALDESGLDLADVSGATIRVADLVVDLEAAAKGDVSSIQLVADAGLDRLSGVLAESGDRLDATGFLLRAEAVPLRSGVHVTAAGAFKLNNENAGSIDADLHAIGLLDEHGAFTAGLPTKLTGKIKANAIRTEALQPFLAKTGLVLAEDVGPAIDLSLNAVTSPDESNRIPPTDIHLSLKSDRLNAGGTFRLSADRIETTRNGFQARFDNPGGPLARFITLPQGASIRDNALVVLEVKDLSIPLDHANRQPDLKASAGSIQTHLRRFVLDDARGASTVIRSITMATTLEPGKPPRIDLDGSVKSDDLEGTIAGSMTIENAFEPFDQTDRLAARPVGTITLKNIPTGLLGLAGISVPRNHVDDIPLDQLAQSTVGKAVTVVLRSEAVKNGLRLGLDARSSWHSITADADITPLAGGAYEPRSITADAELLIAQPIARQALLVFLPWKDAAVEIPQRSKLVVSIRTDDKKIMVGDTVLEPTTVGGLSVSDGNGGQHPLGPMKLEAKTSFSIPLAALTDKESSHPFTLDATLDGTPTDGKDRKALMLSANARTALRALAPAGKTNATLRLASQDTGWLDVLTGSNGMLVQALGGSARIDATIDAEPAPDGANGHAVGDMIAQVEINTPRLRTISPVRLTSANSEIVLQEPAEIRWDITPALFNIIAPAKEGKAAQLKLADTVAFNLRAEQLRLPLAGSTAQASIQTTISAPSLPLRFPDDSSYTYRRLRGSLNTLDQPGAARLRLSAIDEERPGHSALDLNATVTGLPDGNEDWTPQQLALTGEFGLDQFPVRLLDAMASGQGDLVELLGQTLVLDAQIKNLPKRGGTFTFDANTQQASSKIRATVRPHPADKDMLAVTLDEPMVAELTHFDYDIEGKKIAFLPIFGSVKKVKGKHDPASVTISRLVAPVEGDVAMILMDGVVDPGVVEYDFQKGLAVILDIAKQNKQGKVGERLQPFTIGMKNGVARFDDLVVPVGEFNMQARGAIDLVNQTEDIVLGVPAGAFADEVIGKLPGAGGALKGDVIVPVRRKGPLGEKNPWRPDFEAVLGNLFENLLKGGLEDLLKGQGKD